MARFERGDVSLYYEIHGEGFPILLFAPGDRILARLGVGSD